MQALLTPEDLSRRDELRKYLENLLNFHDYSCTLHLIGSSFTGLGLRDGDFDVFIQLNDFDLTYAPIHRNEAVDLLSKIRLIIKKEFNMFVPNVINARCPIIRMDLKNLQHCHRGLQCDISIASMLGVYNSQIMKHFLDHEPLFRDLSALMKYWLTARQLIGPNQITSYGCLLMVMFYLQSVSVLPSLYKLQFTAMQRMIEERWNVAFDPSPQHFPYHTAGDEQDVDPAAGDAGATGHRAQKPQLSSLMLGFFNFYANFDFEGRIISPYYGTEKSTKDLLIAHEFKKTDFSIQDLIQLSSNVGQNMTWAFYDFFQRLIKLMDHLIASVPLSCDSNETARRILNQMLESVDDNMVDDFLPSKYYFQNKSFPALILKSTTLESMHSLITKWSVKSVDVVERTLREVLDFNEYTRTDLIPGKIPVTRQSFISQFELVVRESDHAVWQNRNDARRLLLGDGICNSSSANFVQNEKKVTQMIRKDTLSDEAGIEVVDARSGDDNNDNSDDDIIFVGEKSIGQSDVTLTFKLLLNSSINSQLVQVYFDEDEGHVSQHKKEIIRGLKVFLSNYLIEHVQHAFTHDSSSSS